MKHMRRIKAACLFVIISIFAMSMGVFAAETKTDDSVAYNVVLKHWNRRIYDLCFDIQGGDYEADEIRVYAGSNYHLTDSDGEILAEGDRIDSDGNVTTDAKGGSAARNPLFAPINTT